MAVSPVGVGVSEESAARRPRRLFRPRSTSPGLGGAVLVRPVGVRAVGGGGGRVSAAANLGDRCRDHRASDREQENAADGVGFGASHTSTVGGARDQCRRLRRLGLRSRHRLGATFAAAAMASASSRFAFASASARSTICRPSAVACSITPAALRSISCSAESRSCAASVADAADVGDDLRGAPCAPRTRAGANAPRRADGGSQ